MVAAAAAYKSCVSALRVASHVDDYGCTSLGQTVLLVAAAAFWAVTSLVGVTVWAIVRRRVQLDSHDPWMIAIRTLIACGIFAAPLFSVVVWPFDA
jgi:hypothetical protein